MATDLRPELLSESLFLAVLHCKHTTGHASFGAVCQATGIPSLVFSLSLSLSLFYSSLSPSFPPSQIDQWETLAGRTLNQQESLFFFSLLSDIPHKIVPPSRFFFRVPFSHRLRRFSGCGGVGGGEPALNIGLNVMKLWH